MALSMADVAGRVPCYAKRWIRGHAVDPSARILGLERLHADQLPSILLEPLQVIAADGFYVGVSELSGVQH